MASNTEAFGPSFTDERIESILAGSPMTDSERSYLLETVPAFEECSQSAEELAAMSDRDLMTASRYVWTDYARGMGMY